MKNYLFLIVLLLCIISCNNNPDSKIASTWNHDYQAIGLLGDSLYAQPPSEVWQEKWEEKKEAFEQEPDNLDKLIWYGRFTAYKGNYRQAIDIYSQGLEKFPEEPRLLRHRGHRYITVRDFDKAIADLSKAAELIKDAKNQIEEDGIPNAQNIPISTLHGNIYYHLGLAYYLNRDMPKALEAYKNCLSTSSNPDNVVSATHWIYMINKRLGRDSTADNYLRNIHEDMNIIENFAYYKACLLYKGLIPLDSIYPTKPGSDASNSALKYAIGNWFWYNGNPRKGKEVFQEILKGDDWASFGYIAAEADMAKPYVSK